MPIQRQCIHKPNGLKKDCVISKMEREKMRTLNKTPAHTHIYGLVRIAYKMSHEGSVKHVFCDLCVGSLRSFITHIQVIE